MDIVFALASGQGNKWEPRNHLQGIITRLTGRQAWKYDLLSGLEELTFKQDL